MLGGAMVGGKGLLPTPATMGMKAIKFIFPVCFFY